MNEEHNTDRWKHEQETKAKRQELILHVFKRRRAAMWLMSMLKSLGIRYRDLPIGRFRLITTNISTCPCCGQDFPIDAKRAPKIQS